MIFDRGCQPLAGVRSLAANDRGPPLALLSRRPGANCPSTAPTTRASRLIASSPTPPTPSPTATRPIQLTYDGRGSDWYTWLVEDQRFVARSSRRADLADRSRSPIDLTIAGDDHRPAVRVDHRRRCRLGRQADRRLSRQRSRTLTSDGRLSADGGERHPRGRYRKSCSAGADGAEPGDRLHGGPAPAGLHLPAGHRIMVQVQSTWFPVYDRNPQTWVANIFEAKAADFHAETHQVYRTAKYPSGWRWRWWSSDAFSVQRPALRPESKAMPRNPDPRR